MKWRRLALTLAALAGISGCGWFGDGEGGDTLNIGVWEKPSSFDPQRAESPSENMVAPLLFPGLVGLDANGQVMPALAESWDISPDGLVYIFRLRELEWSDGATLDAEDVVASFRRLFTRQPVALKAAQTFTMIEMADSILARKASPRMLKVSALADTVVEIRLAHPEPSFLQRLSLPAAAVVPVHSLRKGNKLPLPEKLVTAGPFKPESQPDDVLSFVRRDEKPGTSLSSGQFRKIRLLVMKDAASAVSAFAENRVDVLDVSEVPARLLDGLDRRTREQLHEEPSWRTVYLASNVKTGPMADARVRQALAIATDQQQLVEASFPEQRVQPLQSLLPPLLPSYGAPAQAEWASWSLDQRDAEVTRLIAEAGYGPQRPLRLRLLMTKDDADQRVAQALQDQWSRFAVQIEVHRASDEADALKQARLGGFDLVRFSLDAQSDSPEDFLSMFGCKRPGRPRMMICNSEADGLVADAVQLNDTVQRIGVLKRAEQLLLGDVPVLPLYVPARRTLVQKRIDGWVDAAAGIHPLAALSQKP